MIVENELFTWFGVTLTEKQSKLLVDALFEYYRFCRARLDSGDDLDDSEINIFEFHFKNLLEKQSK